jgi:uncharacterized membrane protein YfcA
LESEIFLYSVAVLGGFLAGIINTLAGNGSAITLSILTELLGLPGNMANGTNRVGIMAQGITSTYAFHKNNKLNIKRSKDIIATTFIGAILGVLVAISVSNEQFKFVFKFLMVVMFFVILIKPSRWFKETDLEYKLPKLISIPVFLALGFYGGFIQMGMGVFFLAAMVLVARYNIIEANAIKIFIVFLYTIVVLAIFQWKGLINWKYGLIIAMGQLVGGYLSANFASRYHNAQKWAYGLLVVIVIAVLLKLFGFFDLFIG